MILNHKDCLLLLVDVQEKLLKSIHENQSLKLNTQKILFFFNKLNLPIFITEQYPAGLGKTSNEVLNNSFSSMNENINYSLFEKTTFSCFEDSNIKSKIKKAKKKQILICGIETHVCVLQTALDLINDGFSVFLVSDATGARTKYSHELGIQRMEINGTHILNTEMVFFELLRDSKHENFKELSQLIR
jgi:nicotinamidase-related amidase